MDAFALSKKNYPKYWNEERLKNIVKVGKLTEEQYKEITGEEYKK